MDATLNLNAKLLAFYDKNVNSNPKLKPIDWDRQDCGIDVLNPVTTSYQLAVGATQTVLSGARTTTIDGTTTFSNTLLSISASTYRIAATSGTAPGFRTGRGLTLSGATVTFAVQANNLVTLTVSGGSFAAVLSGDTIFCPNTTTGDTASPLSVLNSGTWQVLSKLSGTSLVITRLSGDTFEGVSESILLTGNTQLIAYSSDNVQIGDTVIISNGFSVVTQKDFIVTEVTDSFIQFESSLALPNEVGIQPGNAGMVFYTANKRMLYLEADQECVVRINGDTGNYQRVSPIEPGNIDRPGMFLKWGSVFALTVVNKSTAVLNLLVITAE